MLIRSPNVSTEMRGSVDIACMQPYQAGEGVERSMPKYPEPSEANGFLAEHVCLLCESYLRWTGRNLADPCFSKEEIGRWLYFAPFGRMTLPPIRCSPMAIGRHLLCSRCLGRS